MSNSEQSLPFIVADRYDVTAELGRGGFAIVYRATDRISKRDVAIKILRDDLLLSSALRRFSLEMRVTARLDHPNILHVQDTGVWEGRMFYVMDYVPGQTLEARLRKEGALPVEDALAITRQVGEALAFAHGAGVVHRDTKPANILLGADGAFLGDFGIAHVLSEALHGAITSSGIAVGTLQYMSPEQLCAERVDARSDQYSLALVCYEMLTGVPPHVASGADALRSLRLSGTLVPVSAHRGTLPAFVGDALERALSPAPADRFRDMHAFLKALDGPLGSRHRPAPWYRVHRSRILTTAAVLAVTALGVAAYVGRRPTIDGSAASDAPPVVSFVAPANLGDSAFATRLRTELDEWRDVPVTLTVGAPHVESADDSPAAFRELASRTQATIVLRATRSQVGDSTRWAISVYDDRLPPRITRLSRLTRSDAELDGGALRGLVTRLLVGPAADSAEGIDELPAPRYAAAAAYANGWRLMRRGDFERSKAAFLVAAAQAPTFAHAHLWVAQVAEWMSPTSIESWRDQAQRAASSHSLRGTDSLLALALVSMASDDPPGACARYRAAVERSADSFAALYGLGRCQQYDSVVVRDDHGLRFRTSHWNAVAAYERALERLPAGGMASLFEGVARLTYALGNQVRGGVSLPPDTARYFAMPSMAGDSVVFFPLSRAELMRTGAVPPTLSRALERGRQQFLHFTESWVDRAPMSATAWLDRALALELTGNLDAPDAINSAARALARADSLTSDDELRARINIGRVRVAVRRAAFDDAARLARIELSRTGTPTSRIAALRAPLAAFLLDTTKTVELFRLAAATTNDRERLALPPWAAAALPPWLADSIRGFGVRAVLGSCAGLAARRDNLEAALLRHVAPLELQAVRTRTLHDAYRAAVPCLGTAVLRGFPTEGPLDDVAAAIDAHHPARARSILDGIIAKRRGMSQTTVASDALLAESLAWRAVGDTVRADAIVRDAIANLVSISVFTFDEVSQAAAIQRIRGMVVVGR